MNEKTQCLTTFEFRVFFLSLTAAHFDSKKAFLREIETGGGGDKEEHKKKKIDKKYCDCMAHETNYYDPTATWIFHIEHALNWLGLLTIDKQAIQQPIAYFLSFMELMLSQTHWQHF